jgi:hypothetical protein
MPLMGDRQDPREGTVNLLHIASFSRYEWRVSCTGRIAHFARNGSTNVTFYSRTVLKSRVIDARLKVL